MNGIHILLRRESVCYFCCEGECTDGVFSRERRAQEGERPLFEKSGAKTFRIGCCREQTEGGSRLPHTTAMVCGKDKKRKTAGRTPAVFRFLLLGRHRRIPADSSFHKAFQICHATCDLFGSGRILRFALHDNLHPQRHRRIVNGADRRRSETE